jgi:DNA-binding beta-propeller fold protein YncE
MTDQSTVRCTADMHNAATLLNLVQLSVAVASISTGLIVKLSRAPSTHSNYSHFIDRSHLAGARATAYDRTRDLVLVASSGPGIPLTIIGLSVTGAPRLVGAINGTQNERFLRGARGIAYDEANQLAYVASAVSITSVDIADPRRPTIVGALYSDNHILDAPGELVFDAASQHLFVVGERSASLVVVNVSNSKSLTVTASLRNDLAMQGARGVVYDAASRRVFVASRVSHSLTSIDVSVMSSPKILAILKDSVKLHRAEGVACGDNGHVLVASYGSASQKEFAGTLSLVDARDRSTLKIAGLLRTKETQSACAVVYDPITHYALILLEAHAAVAVVAVGNDKPGTLKVVGMFDDTGMAYPRGMSLDAAGRRVLIVAKDSGSLTIVSLPRELPTEKQMHQPSYAGYMDKVQVCIPNSVTSDVPTSTHARSRRLSQCLALSVCVARAGPTIRVQTFSCLACNRLLHAEGRLNVVEVAAGERAWYPEVP